MANILKNPTHQANLSKNGFDMSMIRKFTSSVGQLLPVYYDILNPGDHVKYGTEMFTRTQPIKTPALMQITEHVDWFFVPITQLYQFFGEMFYGINDIHTNLLPNYNGVRKDMPLMPYNNIISLLRDYCPQGAPDVESIGEESTKFDRFGIPLFYNSVRLLDLCGFSRIFDDTSKTTVTHNPLSFNPLILAAYQKIYNDVFRLGDYEQADPASYNFDNSWQNNQDITNNQIAKLLSLRYRPWRKDFFTNVMPSPLFDGGDLSGNDASNLTEVKDWLSPAGNAIYGIPDKAGNTIAGNKESTSSNTVQGKSLASYMRQSLNTANIRSMFATEKLMEITRRAGKHYDAQTLAHFGYEVPEGIAGEVYRLGSDNSAIQIGDVESTATTQVTIDGQTQTSPLGLLAGKGMAYGRNQEKEFTAPCHGILMAIFSAVPDADYRSVGVDKLNTLSVREDFYTPEYDRLGMQPLFGYQSTFSIQAGNNTEVLGWQYRYSELKSKYNVCNGAFNNTLRNWAPARVQGFVTENDLGTVDPLATMLISPNYLDGVMSMDFKPAKTDEVSPYFRDNLIHMLQFKVFKSSVMSTYGLPNL